MKNNSSNEVKTGFEYINLYDSDTLAVTAADMDDELSETVETKTDDKKENSETFNLKKEIFSYVKVILAALVIAFVFNSFVIANTTVTSSSMESTIMKGDKLISNRLAYVFSSPTRGDIIIFKYPDNTEQKFVKRVIGLPGETIEIKDGIVYINGEALDESYLPSHQYMENFESTVIPEGSYFMMGDNRTNSKDSRYWENKFVTKDLIISKVLFSYSPDFRIIK